MEDVRGNGKTWYVLIQQEAVLSTAEIINKYIQKKTYKTLNHWDTNYFRIAGITCSLEYVAGK